MAYTRGDWLNGLLAGITLAMANLPEEFPVVLTVFLALGAWRISQHGVLTRRPPAIETLGATTVLVRGQDRNAHPEPHGRASACGCQTRNSIMQDPVAAFPPELIEFGLLASEREPFDPMEKAYHQLAQDRAPATVEKLGAWTLAHAYPLSPRSNCQSPISGSRRAPMATSWRPKVRRRRSRSYVRWTAPNAPRYSAQVAKMAGEGLRVLAVARGALSSAHGDAPAWPMSQRELRLQFLGLTGLADPIRPTVPGGPEGMLCRGNTHRDDHRRLPRHGRKPSRDRSAWHVQTRS